MIKKKQKQKRNEVFLQKHFEENSIWLNYNNTKVWHNSVLIIQLNKQKLSNADLYPSASSHGSGSFLNLWSMQPPSLFPLPILGAREPQEYICLFVCKSKSLSRSFLATP